VTIVSWSKILAHVVLKAVDVVQEELKISIEVIDPRTIRPMDYDLVVSSVKKTNRLVIVEEGWPFAGVGAQISHEVAARAFDDLDAPVQRVTQEDVPLPYAHGLEVRSLPSLDRIRSAVKKVLYLD
jgi:pyruvate dehydrogenase E1 component beta subunit